MFIKFAMWPCRSTLVVNMHAINALSPAKDEGTDILINGRNSPLTVYGSVEETVIKMAQASYRPLARAVEDIIGRRLTRSELVAMPTCAEADASHTSAPDLSICPPDELPETLVEATNEAAKAAAVDTLASMQATESIIAEANTAVSKEATDSNESAQPSGASPGSTATQGE